VLIAVLLGALLGLHTARSSNAAGRTLVVTGSLQAAVDAAVPGDVLVLQSTTYVEHVVISRPGVAEAPITIMGAGIGRSVVRGTLVVRGDAAFWRVQDIDVDVDGGDGVRLEAPVHDISLQRMHLYNGHGYGVRIGSDTANVLIEESEIDHFDAGEQDAHGIGIMTARNITIRRCDIHHNSGDSIQSNTPDYPGYGRFASNILIEENKLHDDRENALDIKSTHGLIARRNQMWGFAAVSTSDGMAIQVQYDAQDILIEGNQVWGALEGIEITRGKKNGVAYPAAPQRITIAGNLFRDLGNGSGGGGGGGGGGDFFVYLPLAQNRIGDNGSGSGIVIRASADVKIYNNTVLRAGRLGLYLGTSGNGEHPSAVDVRNNVLDGQDNDLDYAFDPQAVVGLIVDYNHYVNGRVDDGDLSAWLSIGYERHATSGDPGLDDALLPRSDSPLRDSGVDVGRSFTGAAPDRGWGNL
jgi:hypothetical protein